MSYCLTFSSALFRPNFTHYEDDIFPIHCSITRSRMPVAVVSEVSVSREAQNVVHLHEHDH